jgi:hypothetical protein
MTAEMLGASPEHVLLVGVVGEHFDPGHRLSLPVQQQAQRAIGAILAELELLGISHEKRQTDIAPSIWWSVDSLLLRKS